VPKVGEVTLSSSLWE